jgi:C-terminal processing protease CtpA/Prc
VPGGAADIEGHLKVGDVITAVNGMPVIGGSHHDVVRLISDSSIRQGYVTLTVSSQLDSTPTDAVSWCQQGASHMLKFELKRFLKCQ